jgi:hypothetical protein
MIEVPHWVQVFVLVGIALVVIVVPIRILYEMTKDSRERNRRFKDLADRLKERFGGVEAHRTVFGLSRISFQHEGRPATVWQPADDEILPRVMTHDPLIDESIALYATPLFGNYLREATLDGIPAEGKPTGLAESLVILRKMPGVRRFELRMSPSSGFRLSFKLRADDLLYRPEELESAIHHAFQLYDLLVMY